jgi:hypothetical protein
LTDAYRIRRSKDISVGRFSPELYALAAGKATSETAIAKSRNKEKAIAIALFFDIDWFPSKRQKK